MESANLTLRHQIRTIIAAWTGSGAGQRCEAFGVSAIVEGNSQSVTHTPNPPRRSYQGDLLKRKMKRCIYIYLFIEGYRSTSQGHLRDSNLGQCLPAKLLATMYQVNPVHGKV